MSTYTTLSIPSALRREIDQVVTDRRHGYANPSEFIKEAVRLHMERVVKPNLEGMLINRIEAAVYRQRFEDLFHEP
ncbi:MAG: ribbon-helix-helix domain-containing protein [Candidatus Thermoplasmatota archaeon]|nr:ribbon-helix-helix domain-containing protein [Candidatus Thermoplasmatota archaeon]MDD5778926.1 ribbon-helix-helix domain-containing protein [Candidatus Thermoplasmatota archaeon]